MGWRPTSSFARNACRSAPLGPLATMQHEESPPHTRRSRVALYLTTRAVAAGTVICVLSACSATSPMSHILPTRRPSDNPAWLLTRSALSRLALEPAVKARLHASRVFEILQPGQSPVAQVPAEPVVIFESATALEAAVNRGEIAARTYGVLYDPEAWRLTPLAEQQGPVRAAAAAATAAHAHGLRFIVAPALNLTTVLASSSRGPRWRQFLSLNLVGRLARIADILELQAQSLERETAAYTAFVRAATSQALAANPRIIVLAGLSTNPPGPPVESHYLAAAIGATRFIVDGYWLNIPGHGPRCPTCNTSAPEIAVRALQALQ